MQFWHLLRQHLPLITRIAMTNSLFNHQQTLGPAYDAEIKSLHSLYDYLVLRAEMLTKISQRHRECALHDLRVGGDQGTILSLNGLPTPNDDNLRVNSEMLRAVIMLRNLLRTLHLGPSGAEDQWSTERSSFRAMDGIREHAEDSWHRILESVPGVLPYRDLLDEAAKTCDNHRLHRFEHR